ncbi:acyltransferase [Parabacteroides distasonis]|nr:acyltransferase [Parabacteroides distasonis]UVQ79267.1 acyltransferase [Parabacteroides distasonis]
MPSCGSNFQVAHNVTLNSIEGLTVGNNVYLAMGNIIYAHGKAIIGNNVMFGPGCLLTTGNHTFGDGSYRYGVSVEKEVRIKDGCWIAAHCVVLPGAVLPARSILAAGAVLTIHLQELCEDAIYTGIPAKFTKKRI